MTTIVVIPEHVRIAARIVQEWIGDLQGKYDRDLQNPDLSSYYDAVNVIAEEEELEF